MIFASVKNLVKNYGNLCAVDNLSFDVNEGEIFGLIGPNGAGKSTTINIITTLDEMTSGSVMIDGKDIAKQRAEIRRIIRNMSSTLFESTENNSSRYFISVSFSLMLI